MDYQLFPDCQNLRNNTRLKGSVSHEEKPASFIYVTDTGLLLLPVTGSVQWGPCYEYGPCYGGDWNYCPNCGSQMGYQGGYGYGCGQGMQGGMASRNPNLKVGGVKDVGNACKL